MNAMSPAMLEMIRNNKAKYAGGNTRIKKFPEGKTRLRIIPTIVKAPLHVGEEAERFWLEYGVHWIKAPGNPKPLAVVGNSMLVYGTLGPLETMIEQAIATATTDEDIKFYTEMKARKGILVNALNRTEGSAEASENPAVYEFTSTTWGKVLGLMAEYYEENGNIFDLKTGMDITIERTGKGMQTEYTPLPCFGAKNKPVSKESQDKVIDLFQFVEKEFFRAGDETKALTILSNATGLALPALGTSRPATALLSATTASQATRVVAAAQERKREADELNEIAAASAAFVEDEAPPTAPVVDEDAEEAELMAKLAARRAAKAAAAAPVAPAKVATPAKAVVAPAKVAEPADDFDQSDLSLEELSGQLENI